MIITPPLTREQQIVLKVAEKRVGGMQMITRTEAMKAFKTLGEYCLENDCEKCIFGIHTVDDPCIFSKGNEPYCITPKDIQKVYKNANVPEE